MAQTAQATLETRRIRAAEILEAAVDAAQLSRYVPGEPSGFAAGIAAARVAPTMLQHLARLHDVRHWDDRTFREAFAEAMGAWRPGQSVSATPRSLKLTATTCPVAGEVERDPRVCQLCRAIQEESARLALPGRVKDVLFESRIAGGDAVCTTEIVFRDRPA